MPQSTSPTPSERPSEPPSAAPDRWSAARKLIIAVLLVVVLVGGWQLVSEGPVEAASTAEAEAGPAFGAVDEEKEALLERTSELAEILVAGDLESFYELVDPQIRANLDYGRFYTSYGHKALKIWNVTVENVVLDPEDRSATVTTSTDAELIVSNMPAKFRPANATPEDLRQQMTEDRVWRWRDGEWFVALGEMPADAELIPLDEDEHEHEEHE